MKNFTYLFLLVLLQLFGAAQNLLQVKKLTPSNRAAEDVFGLTAIAVDGVNAIIGSPGKFVINGTVVEKYAGGAHSFLLTDNGWGETGFIQSRTVSQVDNFGTAIAMNNGGC